MGQYHLPINLDKKEFIHPHKLGNGLKLWEQAASAEGVCAAVCMLCAVSNGRGGGDFRVDYPEAEQVIGRWGGDRIAWVGDYAKDTDLPLEYEASTIYNRCGTEYTDISEIVTIALEHEFGFEFTGDGWRHKNYASRN